MKKVADFLSPGIVPFMFAILFSIFILAYKALGLPTPAETAVLARDLYDEYGIYTLLIAAFVEGVFMVNIYFPGSFVIILAVFLSDKGFLELSTISLLVWCGFLLAGSINYWLGQEGFYKALLKLGKKRSVDNMRTWMDKRGSIAIFIAAIHPNFLAISQVCMGVAEEGYKKNIFLSGIALGFWVPFWTFVFSILISKIDITDSNQAWYMVFIFIMWGLVLIVKNEVYPPNKSN